MNSPNPPTSLPQPTLRGTIPVFRIQDASGRGPWRPGFSQAWVDPTGKDHLPIFAEVPNFMKLIAALAPNEHAGCACRSVRQLADWFTAYEIERLAYFRFKIVRINATRILAETPTQILFATNKPLRSGAVIIPWSELRSTP